MTKKIVGATYTVIVGSPEFPFGYKVVLCHDDDTCMPLFSPKDQYAPDKDLAEMDWQYVDMDDVSLDEASPIELGKPFEISVNGIKVTIPSSTTSITINGKTNAIEISWEEV